MNSWVTDGEHLDPRFPHYTRANADEVGPEPISPLGWTLVFAQGVNLGGLESWIKMGVLSEAERAYKPRGIAIFGGYLYNNLSLARLFGARMPGGDVEHMDRQSFGDRPDTPPYEPHPDDVDPECTATLGAFIGAVMAAGPYPAIDETWQRAVERSASRPAFDDLSDAELLDAVRAVAPAVREVWESYIYVSIASTIGPAALQTACTGLGRPDVAAKLISGVGDVVSARAPRDYWRLGRMIAGSLLLTREFDRGVPDVLDRLAENASDDAARFLDGFQAFIAAHGHRGPNEWDMRSTAWEEEPTVVLGILDRLRFQSDDHDPEEAAIRAVEERERLFAEVRQQVGADGDAGLEAALNAAHVWAARREKGKDACVRFIHESRMAARALGRRCAERGDLLDENHIFMVRDDELDALVGGGHLADEAASRAKTFTGLADLEPPYFVDARVGSPPLSTWPRRGRSDLPRAQPGEVLTGSPGAPGTATGRARVVLDPEHSSHLEPGDVLVVRSTDPSWTPLFLSVAGVVSDGGATISHAAIVSRELGIPCVLSCGQATERIPDGALVSLDGATGTVTILQEP